jgi:peptide/nickel transport system ATP-binding protein
MSEPLLEIDELCTRFDSREGRVHAVDGVSFGIDEGEVVGVVGESGSGKSATALSCMRLEDPGEIVDGSIRFRDTEMTTADDRTVRRIRGSGMSMVFQDPMTTLNPVYRVSDQIAESLKIHDDPDGQRLLDYLQVPLVSDRKDWQEKRRRALQLMEEVGIPEPHERVDAYPHEFSGGMRQRAMLAIALASDPDLLIADEPTTALDVTIQAQILDELRRLNEERDMAVILITHDLGVVASICDRVVVLYGGEVMETGPTERILNDPRHPYTRVLLECLPQNARHEAELHAIEGQVPDMIGGIDGCPFASRCEYAAPECRSGDIETVDVDAGHAAQCCRLERVQRDAKRPPEPGRPRRTRSTRHDPNQPPVLEVRNVTKEFPLDDSLLARLTGDRTVVRALSDVSLSIRQGETLGLVGESGSGKSTLANVVAGLETPTRGEVYLDGTPLGGVSSRDPEVLTDIGMVFQNARASLDSRMTVRQTLAEPLKAHGWKAADRRERVDELLGKVDLGERFGNRYPHELSGGEAQRVAIARALALSPRLVLLDEPVSALDVSIQAKILNLLVELQADLDLTYLFIAHDLNVVRYMADRIAVLYLGEIMERAPAERLFAAPTNPYTETLISAIPRLDPGRPAGERIVPQGDVPSPVNPPSGCVFHPRCHRADEECARTHPELRSAGDGESRCHYAEELEAENDAD